eukprot:11219998-Lingulodinium_polyedra.AAC.1
MQTTLPFPNACAAGSKNARAGFTSRFVGPRGPATLGPPFASRAAGKGPVFRPTCCEWFLQICEGLASVDVAGGVTDRAVASC